MQFSFADCILDDVAHVLKREGTEVLVEPQVFDLLALLASNPGRLIDKDEIIAQVWQGRIISDSAISARIAAARKAVGDDGKTQAIIRTVARRGLQMVADVNVCEETLQESPVADEIQRIRYVRLPSGHSMAYAVTGSGPPVIMVETQSTDLEAEWQLSFERTRFQKIAQHSTLIRYDPVGVGQSERTSDRLTISEKAEEIGWLADAMGIEKFALYSHSGGCMSALHFASQNPERVSRLVMLGGYVDGRAIRDGASESASEPLRALIKEGWALPDSGLLHAMMMSYQPEGPLESVKAYARMMQNGSSAELEVRRRDIINTHSSAALLHLVTCPTLILHSRHDSVHLLSEAKKLAAGISGAELVVLDSSNHIPWLGNPAFETLQSVLTTFLSE
ncbi:alpha/beta fold hydrolase [Shimia abyssi]|uniref:DNA-binding winged helix-turn-helix (WHTH) protein n=1 Tax=Shimia abyssi TaxID=1662395 RepID=A0A2P8FCJ8_9RHOB|nr:alpha/beta fold hydrolase [Shimia abyssi]PSL19435.1 DNA-binding winged helix-turn-helix (wHTH) protein [Shimia abyssi]